MDSSTSDGRLQVHVHDHRMNVDASQTSQAQSSRGGIRLFGDGTEHGQRRHDTWHFVGTNAVV